MPDCMVGATEHSPAPQAPAKSRVLWERSGEEAFGEKGHRLVCIDYFSLVLGRIELIAFSP